MIKSRANTDNELGRLNDVEATRERLSTKQDNKTKLATTKTRKEQHK